MAELDQPTRDILGRLQVDVNNAPAVTPALLAYLRGLGMDLSTAESIRSQRLSRLGTTAAEGVSNAERDYGRSRQSTTADLQRSGVLRSGQASTRFGRLAEDQNKRIADIYTNQARGSEEVEQGFAGSRDVLRRNALEQLMGAEQSEAVRKAQSESETRQINAQTEAQDRYYKQMEALAKRGIG